MKIILGFIAVFLLTGCTISAINANKKRSLEDCVIKLVEREVPIEKATVACKEIYENIQKDK